VPEVAPKTTPADLLVPVMSGKIEIEIGVKVSASAYRRAN